MTATIFDMDGLLLDTEPLWGESMLKIAGRHKVNIRSDFFKYTTGLRINEVTAFWRERFGWESDISADGLAGEIVEDIVALSVQKSRLMPGVKELLQQLKDAGMPMGVATSSPQYMMETLLKHFGIYDYFQVCVSAEHEVLGKPHPAVYLKCAAMLEVPSWNCVAFEDSVNGVISAKAARMKVVAVPDEYNINNPKFAIADKVVDSLVSFDVGMFNNL